MGWENDVLGNKRDRDRIEIYIFSNEPIFNDGEVREGGHRIMTTPSLHYFIETGHIGIAGRNDLRIRSEILDHVDGAPKTKSEILAAVSMPTVAKKMLNRML